MWSPFASRREFEGLLRFLLPPNSDSQNQVDNIFQRFTTHTELVAMREAIQGEVLEYSYSVRLIDPSYKTDLGRCVRQVAGHFRGEPRHATHKRLKSNPLEKRNRP